MAKKNIDELFLEVLNEFKESNMNDDLYNFILNSYENEKEYFSDNIVFKNNRELFYTIYINFKTILTSHNYSDYCKKVNSLSLIYFDKQDEENNYDIMFHMTNILFHIEANLNDKDINQSNNILYCLRVIFRNKNYLKDVLSKILNADDINAITNFLLDLRQNISEDELFNIFNYVINNINKKDFDLEEFLIKIKQNNFIYLEDYKYFTDFEKNHNELFENVNENIESYKILMDRLSVIKEKYNTSLDNMDSCLSSIVRKLNKPNN